jgi:hypothetical protein
MSSVTRDEVMATLSAYHHKIHRTNAIGHGERVRPGGGVRAHKRARPAEYTRGPAGTRRIRQRHCLRYGRSQRYGRRHRHRSDSTGAEHHAKGRQVRQASSVKDRHEQLLGLTRGRVRDLNSTADSSANLPDTRRHHGNARWHIANEVSHSHTSRRYGFRVSGTMRSRNEQEKSAGRSRDGQQPQKGQLNDRDIA